MIVAITMMVFALMRRFQFAFVRDFWFAFVRDFWVELRLLSALVSTPREPLPCLDLAVLNLDV